MKKTLVLLILIAVLAGLLAGCGATPEPTEPPPTQTPKIIIITTTPCAEMVAKVESTPVVVTVVVTATPTPTRQATPTPTERATTAPGETPVSPTETPEPTQTAEPTTTQPPAATNTPQPAGPKYPPPVLLEPPDNRPVSWRSTVLLKWNSVGELAGDEYYHLHLERRPKTEEEPWYGDYVYTKETEHLLEASFLTPFHPEAKHGPGVIYWWVRVVRKTSEDTSGKPIGIDIGASSEERTLILEPKPEGQ